MKRLIFTLVLMLIVSFYSNCVYAAPQPDLTINSKAAILIDGQTGQIVFEQNPNLRLYPASTTKIITAILAIENGKMDQQITASKAAVNEIGINGSNIGLASGEIMPLEDVLNGMLIKSANDCANVIAENLCATRNDFVDLMNKRAAELGATDTTFTNTCGLDKSDGHPNHMTTVSDMSKIARYAMTLPKFREIVQKQKYIMHDTNKHPATFWPQEYISTTNRFLLGFTKYKTSLFSYTGIKTGYTALAGCNIIASGKNDDGMELIAVVYGAKDQEILYSETKKLLEYGFNVFGVKTLVNSKDIASKVSVANAKDENTSLNALYNNTVKTVLPKEYDVESVTKTISIKDNLTAPIEQGEVIGSVEFKKDNYLLGKVDLIASDSVIAAAKPNHLKSILPNSTPVIYIKDAIIAAITLYLLLFGYRFFLVRSISKKKKKFQNIVED